MSFCVSSKRQRDWWNKMMIPETQKYRISVYDIYWRAKGLEMADEIIDAIWKAYGFTLPSYHTSD